MKRNFKKEGRGMMDKHLPVSVWPEWKIVEKSDVKEYNGTKFSFVTYKRV